MKVSTSLIDFDDLALPQAAQQVQELSRASGFGYVVTPNVDHLARLCDRSSTNSLNTIYRGANLSLCDSRIIKLLLKWASKPVEFVVPGSDLTHYLFDHTLQSSDRILIVGGNAQTLKKLANIYPHLSIEQLQPSMGFIHKPDEVASLIEAIKHYQAHYVFLAVGSPRQEVLASKLKAAGVDRGVGLCIGASINFIVAQEHRAPQWVQTLHMEWCYRMLQDPSRLIKRYASNALYLPKIFWYLKKER